MHLGQYSQSGVDASLFKKFGIGKSNPEIR